MKLRVPYNGANQVAMAGGGKKRSRGNPKLKAVSLYTGAGGLDLGLEAAGFETAVAVEMDRDCCETMRANRRWPVLERNVHEVPSEELLEVAGLKVGDVDLLAGGPPCQPFSKSSYWVNGDSLRLNDPRANTLVAYLRVLRDLKPKAFLLENVHGLAYAGKDEGLRLLLEATRLINEQCGTNYQLSWRVLQAADYGVPQLRERVFVVGQRDGVILRFPPSQYFPGDREVQQSLLLKGVVEPYRNAWDAIGDLEEPTENLSVRGKWGDLLPSIPEGQNYLWHTDRMAGLNLFGWRTRYWSFLLKLAKQSPSWTIQASPGSAIGPFHWKNRRLTVREMCRLQTFPDDFEIVGGRTSAQRQLGNAVPSLLSEVLGREIRKQLLGCPAADGELKLLPARRVPVPAPEQTKPVARKYRQYVGDHEPHPGNGKGRRAAQRLQGELLQ